ncbi:MAG: stage sporulation protein [Tepidanaerobacteraceae bacterium]|nr:stage sporulation protein [Tepidanaerobacteraceae bacterium]
MINFRVIKIKKYVQFVIIGILLLMMIVLIVGAWHSTKSLAVFAGGVNRGMYAGINIVQRLNEGVFKKIICWGLPMMDAACGDEGLQIDYTFIAKYAFKVLTNADFDNPKSYFSMQVPIMGLVASEAVSTPGVEMPTDYPPIVENEHEPSQNPPEPPEDETPTEVEKIAPVKGKPLVLIYHTHTTESYMPSKAFEYKPRDKAYHTDDLNFSVVRVGNVLTDELNRLGIPTLHDITVHDVPTYMTSYANSAKTVERVLKANPSIKIIIDLHRDAPVADPQKSRELTTVKINGKTYSRIMLVIGSDKIFPNSHWRENYQFGKMINKKLEELYPGITRDIDLREQRFNQHLSNKAILVEIGSHGNTMEESIASAKVFAKALSEVIKGLTL